LCSTKQRACARPLPFQSEVDVGAQPDPHPTRGPTGSWGAESRDILAFQCTRSRCGPWCAGWSPLDSEPTTLGTVPPPPPVSRARSDLMVAVCRRMRVLSLLSLPLLASAFVPPMAAPQARSRGQVQMMADRSKALPFLQKPPMVSVVMFFLRLICALPWKDGACLRGSHWVRLELHLGGVWQSCPGAGICEDRGAPVNGY
jgi:hypothetical protein